MHPMMKRLLDMAGKTTNDDERAALIWAIERAQAAERASAYVESAVDALKRAASNLPSSG